MKPRWKITLPTELNVFCQLKIHNNYPILYQFAFQSFPTQTRKNPQSVLLLQTYFHHPQCMCHSVSKWIRRVDTITFVLTSTTEKRKKKKRNKLPRGFNFHQMPRHYFFEDVTPSDEWNKLPSRVNRIGRTQSLLSKARLIRSIHCGGQLTISFLEVNFLPRAKITKG